MRASTTKVFFLGLLVAAIVLFPADGLRALGLGEARVDSYLGQPLDVSIRLIEPDGGALDSLTVASATADDYERLGIPAAALGLGLDVSVDRRVDPPLIKVRSDQEVIDPVVQILVDARWSSGRVLREYTLFLDPPTLPVAPPIRRVDEVAETAEPEVAADPAPITPVRQAPAQPAERVEAPTPRPAPPRVETPEPEATPEPAVAPAVTPEPIAQAAEPAPVVEPLVVEPAAALTGSSRTVGPVAPGQTLWSIAYAWRPSTGLTMNQVMLAILDRNPQAFINGNVNQLRRDAMLTMPSSDDIASIGASEADQRMRSQMQSWQPGTAVADVPVISDEAVPEVMAESEQAPVDEVDDAEYRLEVVPPEGEAVEDVPAVSETEVAEASSRLSDLEDQFYADGLVNDELYRQVEEIRDAIEARDLAGMAVANEELANLEARLREAREAQALEAELAAEADALAAAADEAPVDEVDEYFSELEGELGLESDDADAASAEELTPSASDEADMAMDGQVDSEPVATAPEDAADASTETVDTTTSMPMTRTSRDDGLPAWMYALILGAVALVGGAAYYFFGIRRKPESASTPAPTPALGVDAVRERVADNRSDLDAHLALLSALAAEDDQEAFSDALDGMYAEVDNEDDPRWQEALNLAVLNAPDHPLLTPRETGFAAVEVEAEEGLDDRTREMLGILESPEEDEGERTSGDDIEDELEIDSTLELNEDAVPEAVADEADDFFSEDESGADSVDEDDFTRSASDTVVMGDVDMDLADLSDRLDDDSRLDLGPDEADMDDQLSPSGKEVDFSEESAVLGDSSEDPVLASESDDTAIDLDFEFSTEDKLTIDDVDGEGDDQSKVDFDSPADTLDLSNEAGSNDTLRMDPDELQSLSETAEAAREEFPETVRADDTLDLVSGAIDFEDVGDRELEAFLAEGDDSSAADDSGDESSDDELSILDMDSGDEGEPELSDEDADVKLDLARAYLSMDDPDSARTLLDEIVSGGSIAKRSLARELLDEL